MLLSVRVCKESSLEEEHDCWVLRRPSYSCSVSHEHKKLSELFFKTLKHVTFPFHYFFLSEFYSESLLKSNEGKESNVRLLQCLLLEGSCELRVFFHLNTGHHSQILSGEVNVKLSINSEIKLREGMVASS